MLPITRVQIAVRNYYPRPEHARTALRAVARGQAQRRSRGHKTQCFSRSQ
jgi:hypothetical protein